MPVNYRVPPAPCRESEPEYCFQTLKYRTAVGANRTAEKKISAMEEPTDLPEDLVPVLERHLPHHAVFDKGIAANELFGGLA